MLYFIVTLVVRATPVGTGLYWECCKMAQRASVAAACFLMAQLSSCCWTSGCWGQWLYICHPRSHLHPWGCKKGSGPSLAWQSVSNTGKKKKALEGTYPMLMPPAQKPDPQGWVVSFKLPFLFFFLVESTIGVRSQRGWFYLKVLWSWKSWDFYHFIFTEFRVQFCVW